MSTKRGPRISKEQLEHFMSWECGSRCLHDGNDLEAVVKKLYKAFRIYTKISTKSKH